MKIALIGASGNIGKAIAREAVNSGHAVTALTRRTGALADEAKGLSVVAADVFDRDALAAALRGHDVVASAYGPGADSAQKVAEVATALVAAARAAGIKRVIVVGGAGSLEVASGVQLVDTPSFPEMYKAYALAHREALAVLRAANDLEWTFFAPAAEIGPGEKRGTFRVGTDKLIVDGEGRSRISYDDYADAFVREIEAKAHVRGIVTAAY